jgi:hypothetical protein
VRFGTVLISPYAQSTSPHPHRGFRNLREQLELFSEIAEAAMGMWRRALCVWGYQNCAETHSDMRGVGRVLDADELGRMSRFGFYSVTSMIDSIQVALLISSPVGLLPNAKSPNLIRDLETTHPTQFIRIKDPSYPSHAPEWNQSWRSLNKSSATHDAAQTMKSWRGRKRLNGSDQRPYSLLVQHRSESVAVYLLQRNPIKALIRPIQTLCTDDEELERKKASEWV